MRANKKITFIGPLNLAILLCLIVACGGPVGPSPDSKEGTILEQETSSPSTETPSVETTSELTESINVTSNLSDLNEVEGQMAQDIPIPLDMSSNSETTATLTIPVDSVVVAEQGSTSVLSNPVELNNVTQENTVPPLVDNVLANNNLEQNTTEEVSDQTNSFLIDLVVKKTELKNFSLNLVEFSKENEKIQLELHKTGQQYSLVIRQDKNGERDVIYKSEKIDAAHFENRLFDGGVKISLSKIESGFELIVTDFTSEKVVMVSDIANIIFSELSTQLAIGSNLKSKELEVMLLEVEKI